MGAHIFIDYQVTSVSGSNESVIGRRSSTSHPLFLYELAIAFHRSGSIIQLLVVLSEFEIDILAQNMQLVVLVVLVLVGIVCRSNAFAPLTTTVISTDRGLSRADTLRALPDASEWLSTSFLLSESEKDYGELIKSAAIVLTLGGGLIPATISANSAMMKTLSGRKDAAPEADPSTIKPGESFDPTIFETKYRQYIEDSGAEGKCEFYFHVRFVVRCGIGF